jgi:hypothetical protein
MQNVRPKAAGKAKRRSDLKSELIRIAAMVTLGAEQPVGDNMPAG